MANMTFKTNILPNSDFGYSLGSSTNPQARWNVYGNLIGNASTATTATNLAAAPSLTASGNDITVTAGGKTSSAFTVPYATNAGTATKLGTANKGSSMQPIYLSAGAPNECTIPSNGAWWSAIPQILPDGVMEVGKYIDFHTTSNGTTDYDVRITANTTGLTISGTTVGTFSGNLNGTASIATKLGTANKGSGIKPIYLSAGAPAECSTYAGGTNVTLNNSNKGGNTASFYAPTESGTANQILVSGGSSTAPSWKATANGAAYATSDNGELTFGTLPVAQGGTGKTAQTAQRLCYTGTDGGITSGYHFATSTKVAIASISEPTATFYVNGTAEIKTQLYIPSTSDVDPTTAPGTTAPLVIGSKTGAHIELDKNEIVAKASGTSAANLWFNNYAYVDPNGNIGVEKNQPSITVHDNTNNGIGASIIVGSGHQNHGLYSNGYAPSATTFTSSNKWIIYRGSDSHAHSELKIYGAVYNDYAEMRNVPEAQIESNPLRPGTCVCEVGDGTMVATTERLQRGCKIISDTFGFNIGETEDCKTPIAVSGRALVYLDQDRENARNYIGWPVCSGPDGTVSIMTEEEEEKYPSRIVGTISEIPDYEKWGSSNVEVNGRIWIYVK